MSRWARLKGWFAPAAPRAFAAATPTIAPYEYQRSARDRRERRRWFFTAVIAFAIILGFYGALFPLFMYKFLAIPLIVLAAVAIWLLPEAGRHYGNAIDKLFFGYLIAFLAWPNYLAIATPGLPWITFSRLFTAPMLLLFLVSLSISAEFRAQVAAPFKTNPWPRRLVVALVTVEVLTLPMSEYSIASITRFLNAQVELTAMFFIAVWVFQREGRPLLFVKLTCFLALFVGAIGWWQDAIGKLPWAGHIPSFLAVQDEAVQRTLQGFARSATGAYRVTSVFTTSLDYAQFLGLSTPLFVYFALNDRRPLVRAGSMAAVAALLPTILISDSRLGMVAYFATLLGYVLLWAVQRWRARATDVIAPAVVLAYPAIAALFFAATFASHRLHNMIWGTGATIASDVSRATQLENTLPLVAKWPLGYGFGAAAPTLGFTNREGVLTIDNYYLTLVLDFGVAGLALFIALFGYIIFRGARGAYQDRSAEARMLSPLVLMIGAFLIVKWVLSSDNVHPLYFIVLALITALCARIDQRAGATR